MWWMMARVGLVDWTVEGLKDEINFEYNFTSLKF